jgi:CBS domain-containing protein/anti-sigma regulatory factor (Ser/Thr protein kinase)
MDETYATRQILLMELKVGDVMHKDVVIISPEARMSELRMVLYDNRISGTPVVEGDELVGIISIEDLIRWLSDGAGDYRVGDRMTKNPEIVFADQPLINVIRLIDKFGYGRFPVLDRKKNKLVGIVTKGDIIEGTLKKIEKEYKEEEIRQYRASHIFEDITAEYKEIYLTYKVKSKDFDHAGHASTQMKRNLKRLGIRPDVIHKLSIASYEAEMNIVLHSEGGIMEYRVAPEEVILKIEDYGPGIEDVEKAMKPGYSTASEWIRELGFGAGMGLSNIKKYSDKMEIRSKVSEGTTIIIHIRK